MNPKFDAHMEDGCPVIDDVRFTAFCGKWSDGTPLTVTVRKRRKGVSNAQLRYYYGVICKMVSEAYGNHSVEEWDSIFKLKFMTCVDDSGWEFIPSKTENSTITQEEFHAKCREWIRDHIFTEDQDTGQKIPFHIPLPNEVELDEHVPIR